MDEASNKEKVLSQYDNMTKDELINILGDKYSIEIKQRIKEGNITLNELYQLCVEASSNDLQRAEFIFDGIIGKLSRVEAFNLVESDPEKRKKFALFQSLKEKAKEGKLTLEELKFLCDTAFGKDSIESENVYEKMKYTPK